jgi:hypothetical protein
MSDAPAELWVRQSDTGTWHQHILRPPAPDAVRYVRADLYEALVERMRVVRSWNEAPCLDPLGSDIH